MNTLQAKDFPSLVKAAIQRAGVVETIPLREELAIGNVVFWIDLEGHFAGVLSYDLPSEKWDHDAIATDLTKYLTH